MSWGPFNDDRRDGDDVKKIDALESRIRTLEAALKKCVDSWGDYRPKGNARVALDEARRLLEAKGRGG